ncbi:type III pantothenate kinase [Patiriisocius hiemis]|uniref:Type III pantothenate kinase n=1 Tax=Patiriisocius hiemis TaxID=3075604 RepID=A0ABU2YER7_9FLAO|nr:type III pantothenate kinase [Constantimarinum sp. W242]MDT0556275.1 type III pantothenate kinase [Constantimarinum sp. W242]
MNLIIDVGNTRVKVAVFKANKLEYKDISAKETFTNALVAIREQYPNIKKCIVSSVGNLNKKDLLFLKESYSVLELNHKTKIPFTNKYATPKTLGVDRIALVASAAVQFPKVNCLLIDAGSCITYDFLSSKNEYYGGAIAPGIGLRYKSLEAFTANLPLLDKETPDGVIGDSTNNAIHSGVINGVIFEIEGFIRSYREKYDDLTVILTGGDAHFLRDSLKNDIFANSNFLLEGLHYILEHNKD